MVDAAAPLEVHPALAQLSRRRSTGQRGLAPPAPSPDDLQMAAELALCAPDHQGLRPFRFVHVGEDARSALGDLFAAAAHEQGRDAEGVDAARARAAVGPGLLAVVARIRDDVPDVPAHEQWMSVGAGVMNLLNALHLMGYGAKVLGGSLGRTACLRQAFCHEGEQLACWVICGTPVAAGNRQPEARQARDLLTDWEPLLPGCTG